MCNNGHFPASCILLRGSVRRSPQAVDARLGACGMLWALLGLLLCSAAATTLKAQPAANNKTNTVLLSAVAVDQMTALLAEKPGRVAMDVAATGSMQPLLDENYIIVVEQRPFEELSFGDIPIFRGKWVNNLPVAHRIIQRLSESGAWQTKGDHCENADPQRLTRENYQGRIVVAAIHKATGAVKQLSRTSARSES